MPTLREFENMREQVRQESLAAHSEAVEHCRAGIGLMLEAWDHVGGREFDPTTSDGASKLLAWRFMCSMPSNALWCLEAACAGQAAAAGALLRVLFEEAFGMQFYVRFPIDALKHVTESPGKDKADFDEKLDRLGLAPTSSLRRFYGELSNMFSHGNALLRPEFVVNNDLERTVVRGEPKYVPAVVPFIAEYVDRAMSIALGTVLLEAFSDLHTAHPAWSSRVTGFVVKASSGLSEEK